MSDIKSMWRNIATVIAARLRMAHSSRKKVDVLLPASDRFDEYERVPPTPTEDEILVEKVQSLIDMAKHIVFSGLIDILEKCLHDMERMENDLARMEKDLPSGCTIIPRNVWCTFLLTKRRMKEHYLEHQARSSRGEPSHLLLPYQRPNVNDKYNEAAIFVCEENYRRFNDLLISGVSENTDILPSVRRQLLRAQEACELISDDPDAFGEDVRERSRRVARLMQDKFDRFHPENKSPTLRSLVNDALWGLAKQSLTVERAKELMESLRTAVINGEELGLCPTWQDWEETQTYRQCKSITSALGKYINSLESSEEK